MDPELDEQGNPIADGGEHEQTLEEALNESIGLTESTDVESAEAGAPEADAAIGEADPAADPAAKPAPDAAAAAAAAADPAKDKNADLYAPLPEHNQRKTHERFQRLVEGHKELEAKVQELQPLATRAQELEAKVQEHEQGWEVFKGMGFQGEEAVQDLVEFSEYRRALGSGDWDAAAAVITRQAQQLSLMSGRRIDLNPLAGFPDLDAAVQEQRLDEATALELARSRAREQVQQRNHQATQQTARERQQATAQQTETITKAAREVDVVVQTLMRDPDYAKVEPELIKQLADIKANYHPSQWPREVKRAYDTEARILRAARPARTTTTPLRNSGHAGGRQAPTSMQDAVLQSLGLD